MAIVYLVIGVAAADYVRRAGKVKPPAWAYGIGGRIVMRQLAARLQEEAGGDSALVCYEHLPYDIAIRRYRVYV